MPNYIVTAKVSLLVRSAKNAEEAKDMFREQLITTSFLLETPKETLNVKVAK